MQVGFIGVGRMGTAMARNLMKAGHKVLAWDVSQTSRDRIKNDGAAIASSAREAFSGDAVISMLPNDAADPLGLAGMARLVLANMLLFHLPLKVEQPLAVFIVATIRQPATP